MAQKSRRGRSSLRDEAENASINRRGEGGSLLRREGTQKGGPSRVDVPAELYTKTTLAPRPKITAVRLGNAP